MEKKLSLRIWCRNAILKVGDTFLRILVQMHDYLRSDLRCYMPRKILFIKPGMIGDVMFTTPTIANIREAFPEAHLSMLVGRWSKAVLEGNPRIDKIVECDESIFFRYKLWALLKLILALRKEKFDLVVNFQRSRSMNLFAFLVGAPKRIGFDHLGSGFPLTMRVPSNPADAVYPPHMYLKIVEKLGIPVRCEKMEIFPQYEDYTHAIQMLDQISLDNLQKRPVAMCPGGAKNPKEDVEARRWAPENFATLSRLLLVQAGVQTILIGAPHDEEICFKVASLSGCAHNLAGKTTFRQLAALLEHCSLLVSNDSAPIHIGVAVGIAVIGLFGPTNGTARGPKNGLYLPIQSPKSCSPCYANENRFPGCRYPNCMREISVNTVLKEAMLFLEKASGPTISI